MNNSQTDIRRTVAEWQSVRAKAVASRVAAEARIADGDDAAIPALDSAIREVARIDVEMAHAAVLERARADAAKANAAREARAEIATLDAEIAARKPAEATHAAGLAKARIEAETLERDALTFYRESERLLVRRSTLIAKVEGKPAGGTGLAEASFRLDFNTEVERQKLIPGAPPTEFARFYGAPLWPPPRPAPPAPTRVAETVTSEPNARRKRD